MKTDICIILEGTYPYVHGGVSDWIHRIMGSLDDLTFSIVHLSSAGDAIRTPRYDIPSNIMEFREAFIYDLNEDRTAAHGSREEGWEAIRELYFKLGIEDLYDLERYYELLVDKSTRRLNGNDMFRSPEGWAALKELYNNLAPSVSFIDFYWTVRFIHVPILNIFNIDLPDASLYHTVSTGYAGLLAVLAKLKTARPMLLTEHDIYNCERKIDIGRAAWIYSKEERTPRAARSLGFYKDLWIRKFETLGKLTYHYADRIVALFEGARRMQIDGGADPLKTLVIPDGVDLPRGTPAGKSWKKEVKAVGFAGRVVSIKDVKTFIRAMRIVKESVENLAVYIMGPGDEEEDYFEECKTLVQMLRLEDTVIFTGAVDVREYYPKLDVLVLTSISEAQPLPVLEAMSYGVPIVATNVGSCADLVLGKDDEDRQLLGASGMITDVGSPPETASAVIKILGNDELRKKMSDIGMYRVKKYYSEKEMTGNYRDLYGLFLKGHT